MAQGKINRKEMTEIFAAPFSFAISLRKSNRSEIAVYHADARPAQNFTNFMKVDSVQKYYINNLSQNSGFFKAFPEKIATLKIRKMYFCIKIGNLCIFLLTNSILVVIIFL